MWEGWINPDSRQDSAPPEEDVSAVTCGSRRDGTPPDYGSIMEILDWRPPGSGPDSLHGTVLLNLLVGQQEGLSRPGRAGDEFGDVMARCGAVLESVP